MIESSWISSIEQRRERPREGLVGFELDPAPPPPPPPRPREGLVGFSLGLFTGDCIGDGGVVLKVIIASEARCVARLVATTRCRLHVGRAD